MRILSTARRRERINALVLELSRAGSALVPWKHPEARGRHVYLPLYGYASLLFLGTVRFRIRRGDLEKLEGIAVRIAEVEHANDDTAT